MGWTYQNAIHYYKNGRVNRKKECDDLLRDRLVKSCMVGSTYYAAVKNGEEISCMILLTNEVTKERMWNFGYKDMHESEHPYETNCPKSILDLLTPTENELALEWRTECRKKAERPNLSSLPIGSQIKCFYGDKEIILEKKSPRYQFKRPWWLDIESGYYVPIPRIKKYDYEVIKGV